MIPKALAQETPQSPFPLHPYNETAEPFAWTKKRVYQRRFKNRRITQV